MSAYAHMCVHVSALCKHVCVCFHVSVGICELYAHSCVCEHRYQCMHTHTCDHAGMNLQKQKLICVVLFSVVEAPSCDHLKCCILKELGRVFVFL